MKNLAYNITKARKNKTEIKHRDEVPKLSDLALQITADNFTLYPNLEGLDYKWKTKVYDIISTDYHPNLVFPLIGYENFWKRSCLDRFKSSDIAKHGNSWKQCFAENFIKELLTNYSKDIEDSNKTMLEYFDLFKHYIFNLEIQYYSCDFEIAYLLQYFFNLVTLEMKYSPRLIEKDKSEFFKKKLVRKNILIIAISQEYSKFGFRLNDMKLFSLNLSEMNYLLSLTLQGNFIDDEMLRWLTAGLISNTTIRYLDLSNNYITDTG
jgi:hypothetical protein